MRIQSNEQLKSIYQINKAIFYLHLKNSDLFKKPLGCAIGLISGETYFLDFNKQNNKLLNKYAKMKKIKLSLTI